MTETFNVDPQKLNKALGLGLSLRSEPWIEVRMKYHVKQGQQMEYLLCGISEKKTLKFPCNYQIRS